MKPVDFSLHRPRHIDEALELLARSEGVTKVLAGGQSLVPLMNFRLARPDHVVYLGSIPGLGVLQREDDSLVFGAMVRQAQVEGLAAVAEECPLVSAALPHIGHPPIRNQGTVVGSLAHADPAAELPAVALALDATFMAVSQRGTRAVSAADFYRTYFTTDLQDDEFLVHVSFPRAKSSAVGASFQEISRRRGDFALVGAGVQVAMENGGSISAVRAVLSGISDRPVRLHQFENRVMEGSRSVREHVAEELGDVQIVADPHGTADYRLHLAGVLVERALNEAMNKVEQQQSKGMLQ